MPQIDQDTNELVCDAFHWNKVPKTKHWHTRSDPAEEDTIVVNHVVLGDLPLHKISKENEVPKWLPKDTRDSMREKKARKVDEESHESMLQEMSRRAKLEIKQRDDETIAADSGDSEDDLSVASENPAPVVIEQHANSRFALSFCEQQQNCIRRIGFAQHKAIMCVVAFQRLATVTHERQRHFQLKTPHAWRDCSLCRH